MQIGNIISRLRDLKADGEDELQSFMRFWNTRVGVRETGKIIHAELEAWEDNWEDPV